MFLLISHEPTGWTWLLHILLASNCDYQTFRETYRNNSGKSLANVHDYNASGCDK